MSRRRTFRAGRPHEVAADTGSPGQPAHGHLPRSASVGENTTIEDIAEKADVARDALFYYFQRKIASPCFPNRPFIY